MGVALGDSIIGLGVIAWVKSHLPRLALHLYRSRHAPPFVERLYALAKGLIERVHRLPCPLASLPRHAIDLSDFMYHPEFNTLPMVDFFLHGLGFAPDAMPAAEKANRWLAKLALPPLPREWRKRPYALFCDRASTALRSIPGKHARVLAALVAHRYRIPVVGFHPLRLSGYHDVGALAPRTEHFLSWVRGASVLVSTDTAAVHAAAGFDVPTLGFFASIDPRLRTRDYPSCTAIDLRTPPADGLHHSDHPSVLRAASGAWRELLCVNGLPWPEPRPPDGTLHGFAPLTP
jgi:ADP-heptose:LPS heptosyltransferase